MRFPPGSLFGALAVVAGALAAVSPVAAQVRPTPAAPAPTSHPAPTVPPPVDTTGRRLPADSVPLPPPSGGSAGPVGPTRDGARVGADTARKAPAPGARRDSAPPNPFGDLDLQFQGRLESKLERTTNDRCGVGGSAAIFACRAVFQPDFAMQFGVRANGSIEERAHLNVDYDSQREFDASNLISLSYSSKRADAKLGKFELGNVSFAPPASRFITGGIPSNNLGVQALGRLGGMRWRAIAAQQRGNVVRDRVFLVGERASQTVERTIEDYQMESRRFFWTIDPRLLGGYPNVDILDRATMTRLAAQLPDTLRPARLIVYRQLIGAAYQNPRGPRLRVRGARNGNAQTYEVLREGVDYYVDPSLLWIALVRPLGLSNERLAVAYEVNVGGQRVRHVSTGGTPDLELTGAEQLANLVWEPELAPGDSAFVREMRNVYRVGGEDLRRETVGVRVVAGIGDQEKPADATRGATYLQLLGLAEPTSPTTFDVTNRLWPRPQDPNVAQGGGTLGGKILRDHFVVFPSQRPFARDGGLRNTANPANDTLYTYPSEFLNSAQRPQTVFRLRLRYESEGGPDATTLALGSLQLRAGSERLVASGRTLVRGVDYAIDYELGTVTFLDPAGLFPTPTQVTVSFEENPLFVTQPTWIFGAAFEFPVEAGLVYATAISQSRRAPTFATRTPLGYEPARSTVAGVGADLSWNAPVLARLAAKLTSWSRGAHLAGDSIPAARISFRGELAASKPHASASQQAYLETFESGEGVSLLANESAWYYASQPPASGALSRLLGAPLTLQNAATMAWQGNVAALDSTRAFAYRLTEIDPAVRLSTGSGIEPTEAALWLTLYPLRIGGLPSSSAAVAAGAPRFRWTVANAPAGRRWRSIRTVLNPGGADLSRVEDLEFYALVHDPRGADARRNPTLVFDFGDVSENSVAFAPESLVVVRRGNGATAVDSLYRGRRPAGFGRLDTERDPLSRVFNATTDDRGLPGDRADTLVVDDRVSGTAPHRDPAVPICSATLGAIRKLGDPTANCTVGNGRLDEEDIDQDGTLTEGERFRRFVVDLSDTRAITRYANCDVRTPLGLGEAVTGATQTERKCWVLVRVPFRAPSDSVGAFNARRVRAARLTVISGAGEAPEAATTLAVARLRLTGAPWLRRTDRATTGIAGDSTGTAGSFVIAGSVGTQDSTGRVPYTPPPGTAEQPEQARTGLEAQKVQINEKSLRLQAGVPGGELARYERAEAYLRFPEGAKNVMSYRQLRLWARGNGHGWGQSGDLQMFVRLGRDENNFYLYRTPVSAGSGTEAWLPEVRVDFERLYRLRVALQEQLVPGRRAPSRYPCTGIDSALVERSGLPRGLTSRRVAACDGGYMVYSVDGNVTPPNLAAVQELAVGIVRVDDAHRGADAIVAGDTLELWVDDVRLADAQDGAGMAGEVGVGVHFGDLADIRVNLTKRDPQFRQLGESPTFVSMGGAEVGVSLRLDRLLPRRLGLALPLTVTHTSFDATPEFIANTDLRGDALDGLRAPREATTSWALTVRRATPAAGPLAPVLNNLSVTSTYVAGATRSAYQDGARHAFSLRADYDLVPGQRVTLGNVRWTPTTLRLTSRLARTGDRQEAFLGPVTSTFDTARVVTGLDHVWEQSAAVELKPVRSLTARWDASTLRDLRDYGGLAPNDSIDRGAATRLDRTHLGMVDLGFERQRVLSGRLSWQPAVNRWLKPSVDVATTYAMTRDPNAPSLYAGTLDQPVPARDSAGLLPRRIGATQQLEAGATVDLARALFGTRPMVDSASRARAPWLARLLQQPARVTASRTLSTAFDATTADAGLGVQFGIAGLAGIGGLRSIDGRSATLAGVVDRVGVTQTFVLPYGLTLTSRAEGGPTHSWWRRVGTGTVAEGRGTLRTLPDVGVRWAWRPAAASDAASVVSNVGASARMVREWQTAEAPADSLSPADRRATLRQSWPLTGTVTWSALGGLVTSGGVTTSRRTDELPGSRLASDQRDANAEVTRGFKAPAQWGLKSDIRARLGWQDSHTRTLVNGVASGGSALPGDLLDPFLRVVQADLGRRSVSFGANSDVAENMTLGITGSRVTTFNRSVGTRITQTVLSAVLNINFFAGGLH